MSEETPEQIRRLLDLELGRNDSGEATVRGYLVKLLTGVWIEEDEFSGKRPFGNSGWQYDFAPAAIKADLVDGTLDEDGYVDQLDIATLNRLVLAAIRSFAEPAAAPAAPQPSPSRAELETAMAAALQDLIDEDDAEPKPAPELAAAMAVKATRGDVVVIAPGRPLDEGEARQIGEAFADAAPGVGVVIGTHPAELEVRKPDAPRELAAAMGETRRVLDGYAQLCNEFSDHSQSGQSARVSLTVLNRHRKAAGLRARRPAPAGELRDPYMRLREEVDELRTALSALTDRAEASGAITADEAGEYRQRAGVGESRGVITGAGTEHLAAQLLAEGGQS